MKLKKILLSLGMAITVFANCMQVGAVNIVQVPAEEIEGVYNQRVDSNQWTSWPKGPHIYSEAGIVMDADSGAILYAKNIDNPHYPASITKMLTGLVAIENNELTKMVTVTPDDYNFLKRGDNHIGLKKDEQITMEDALHGTLLASGNEVAHAVASNTEGGYENFIKLMNEKAKELGCQNSNFVNSHGLHDDEHYTSARDMALIGSACFQNEDFMRITGSREYTIPTTNVTNETRTIAQHHKMMFSWRSQYYEYCVGGKTGYTDKALNTLVTLASKDGMNLVAVVLRTHGTGNTYNDTRAMLDYAFENFSKVPVTQDMVEVSGFKSIDADAHVMLPSGITFDQLDCAVENPTTLGDKSGKLIYTYEGQPVGEVEFTITDEYYNQIHGIEEVKEKDQPDKKKADKGQVIGIVIKVVFGILGVVLVLFLLLLCYVAYKRHQIRKRRKMRRMKRQRELEYQRYLERMRDKDMD